MKKMQSPIRMILVVTFLAAAGNLSAVTAKLEKLEKDGNVIDEKAITLENEYLSATIATNQHAGQVMKLIYKPTGQDLCAVTPQGYCMDRTGENRYFWKTESAEYQGRIVNQSEEAATVEISYIWNYNHDNTKTRIAVSKVYTLRAKSAELEVAWKFRNIGDQKAMMTPWVKHLGGHDDKLLAGPTLLMQETGITEGKADFMETARDWMVRLSGTENAEKLPMVASVMEFRKIYQQFPWSDPNRFTLETVLSRISLEPGKEWTLHYDLSVMANLGNPLYVCPELAVSTDTIMGTAGKPCAFKVFLSPAVHWGARRLEGEILDASGKSVVKLPHREVELVPGKIAEADYEFTPTSDGIYTVSLLVYENAKLIRLGTGVESQESGIVLPIVIGAKPEKLVKKWQSDGFTWPVRQPAERKPERTLVNNETIKAGQFPFPDRIYPEDRIAFAEKTEPATARMAKGEYEDIEFAIDFSDEKDVMELGLAASPIKNDQGSLLEELKIREVVYLKTEVPSGYKSYPVGLWPDPLFSLGWEKEIPDAPVTQFNLETFKSSKRRVFVLSAKAPRDGAAGTYKGTVTLSIAGKEVGSFPVEFRVDDFAIPKRASFRCSTNMVGFSWVKWEKNLEVLGVPKEKIEELKKEKPVLDRYRELAIEYGWTPTMYFGLNEWEKYYDYGRGVSFFSTGKNPKAEEWLKEKNLLKYSFIYAPFDEHPDAEVPKVVEWAKQWKSESKIPILDCYYGKRVEPLFGLVDIWLGQSPKQPWAKERKKQGDQFIACNSPLVWFIEQDPMEGRSAVWDDFVSGYDGRYVYSTIRWTDDVYKKNWTSGNYMGCTVYPSPDGIASGIRFETLRDAVEDYDYLAVLRDRIEKARGKAPQATIEEAEKILNDEKLADRVRTVPELQAMRGKIADLIVKLRNGQ